MTKLSDVDAALLRWADRFNERHTSKVTARGITGMPIKRGSRSRSASPGDVRQRLHGIVQRRPQVMVKISGGGRGMRSIRAHLNYISRNAQLPVETQEGERVLGRDGLESMAEEWQTGGFPIDAVSTIREAYNIVLSMPAGTNAAALYQAAAVFAQDEFAKHQYALVLHTIESDPNRDPSENPHVHLCVKARGVDGVRLNPRKPDLRRWREQFAERLRDHGVDAEASSRFVRFQPVPGKRQAEYYQSMRSPTIVGSASLAPTVATHRNRPNLTTKFLKAYSELANVLAGSTDVADRRLAIELLEAERGRENDVVGKHTGRDFER